MILCIMNIKTSEVDIEKRRPILFVAKMVVSVEVIDKHRYSQNVY